MTETEIICQNYDSQVMKVLPPPWIWQGEWVLIIYSCFKMRITIEFDINSSLGSLNLQVRNSQVPWVGSQTWARNYGTQNFGRKQIH
jgi:hypothetical protein